MTNPPSQRTIFIWNILGSLSTGLIAFLLLFGVSRFLTIQDGDIYSFAYAIGNLFSIVALFQVRNYQATDIDERYQFSDYLAARFWTCFLMIIGTGVYLWFNQLTAYQNQIIWLICLYRLTDAISDVFQGLFQQKERMDLAGQSLLFRNALMVLSFIGSLDVSHDLKTALYLLNASSVLMILLFDYPQARPMFHWQWRSLLSRRLLSLLSQCFPLFLIGFLLVNIYNQPKYSLNDLYEAGVLSDGVQKDFNILFMPVFVMSLMILILRPLMTQLAIYVTMKDLNQFMALKKRLFGVLGALSILVILGGTFLVLPILEVIYKTPLQQYRLSFFILLCGGVLSSFATLFDNFLTIFRKQNLLILSYVLSFFVSITVSTPMVRYDSLKGAAVAFFLAMLAWLGTLGVTYFVSFRRIKRDFF